MWNSAKLSRMAHRSTYDFTRGRLLYLCAQFWKRWWNLVSTVKEEDGNATSLARGSRNCSVLFCLLHMHKHTSSGLFIQPHLDILLYDYLLIGLNVFLNGGYYLTCACGTLLAQSAYFQFAMGTATAMLTIHIGSRTIIPGDPIAGTLLHHWRTAPLSWGLLLCAGFVWHVCAFYCRLL